MKTFTATLAAEGEGSAWVVLPVPFDLELDSDKAKARGAFDKLSVSKRKLLVDSIVQAKKPETRSAHIEKAVASLR